MDQEQLRRLEIALGRAVRAQDQKTYELLRFIRDGAVYGKKDQGQWKPRLKEDWND